MQFFRFGFALNLKLKVALAQPELFQRGYPSVHGRKSGRSLKDLSPPKI